MQNINPPRRALDAPDDQRKTISADDRKVHLAAKQAKQGSMTDKQIIARGKGATLAKAHLLPDHVVEAINEERRKYGARAATKLAKALIDTPAPLRNAALLLNEVEHLFGKIDIDD
jgi:hypothetical protein